MNYVWQKSYPSPGVEVGGLSGHSPSKFGEAHKMLRPRAQMALEMLVYLKPDV